MRVHIELDIDSKEHNAGARQNIGVYRSMVYYCIRLKCVRHHGHASNIPVHLACSTVMVFAVIEAYMLRQQS